LLHELRRDAVADEKIIEEVIGLLWDGGVPEATINVLFAKARK